MSTVTDRTWMGFSGLSSRVATLEILTHSSSERLSASLPKTGWRDSPGENQSRLGLEATLRKNCEPPVCGSPVLAIDSVPRELEVRSTSSSWMLPPLKRRSV